MNRVLLFAAMFSATATIQGAALYAAEEPTPAPAPVAALELSSLMFSQPDITNLLKVIKAKETNEGNPLDALSAEDLGDADILQEIQRRAMKEQEARSAETTLPDVYISSIVYRSQKDWTVWLRKHVFEPVSISPAASTDATQALLAPKLGEVEVDIEAENIASELIVFTAANPRGDFDRMQIVDITKDQVTLKYKPDAGAIAQKRYQTSDQITPRLKRFMNRVSSSAVAYDEANNIFTVVLKANQTFSLNMMRVIEGRTVAKTTIASKALAAEEAANAAAQKSEGEGDDVDMTFANGDSLEAKAANKLLNDLQKVQKFLPTNQMK